MLRGLLVVRGASGSLSSGEGRQLGESWGSYIALYLGNRAQGP